MKNLTFLVLIAFTLLASSCSNTEKILPKKDGKWKLAAAYKVVEKATSAVLAEYATSGTMVFEKSTVLINESSSTTSTSATWFYDKDKEEITLVTNGTSAIYQIETNEKDKQVWTRDDNTSYTDAIIKVTLTLTR